MIKRISEKDIAACVELIRNSFLTIALQFGFTPENAPKFTAFSTTEDRLKWQFYEEKRPMYAFFDNDKIVGYFSLPLLENNLCELSNLCVSPEYRHKGIGEKLVRYAFREAEAFNCNKMNIGIVEENTVLKKWYETLGFIHTGTKKLDCFPFTCGYMERELKQH